MKKIFVILILAGSLISCSNNDDVTNNPNNKIIEENVNISNNETYEYNLGVFGDEEGAGITTQAKHYEISELEREAAVGKIIYMYKPQNNYIGPDYVEISTSRGASFAGDDAERTIIQIKFNITE